MHRQSTHLFLLLLVCTLSIPVAGDEFYRPASDDEIIAELPADVVALAARVRASATENARPNLSQRQLLTKQLSEIMQSYRLATSSNSERAYGHTLALLQTWPESSSLPLVLRLIKADVLQHNHGFDRALLELDQALLEQPDNLTALQMQSQIHLVKADYDSAQRLCTTLTRFGHRMSSLNCQAQLDGLTGAAMPALARLESVLQSQTLNEITTLELYITAAGLAHRLGQHDQTETHYSNALRLQANNDYVLINYADWLLERGRATDAAQLLAQSSENPNKVELQIVYTEALMQSGDKQTAEVLLRELRDTIEAMENRGEERPSKLLARFYLTLAQDYDAAHREALQNWKTQKEPSDSWLLARAAVAAEQWQSLEQLIDWYRDKQQEDYRLEELLAELGRSQ